MKLAYTLDGSGPVIKKFKVGASVATAGIPLIIDASNDYGEVIPCTTTSFADSVGVGMDTATYTTTQSASMVEGVVSAIINPQAVYKALMSGGATANTTLKALVPTSASSGGTTVTDADVGTASFAGGTVWGISGANAGVSRIETTFNSGTSVVVTVPFPNGIETTDVYAHVPFSRNGSAGMGNLQTTTLFNQANAIIVAGTGGEVVIVELELNGLTDSYVLFMLADQVFRVNTV